MVKVYTLETRKKSYTVVGTSVRDVKEYYEENKKNLDIVTDMSGYYKVILDNEAWVQWYDMCDESVDEINIDSSYRFSGLVTFSTETAKEQLKKDLSLRL